MSSRWLTRHIPGRAWLGLCVTVTVVAAADGALVRAQEPARQDAARTLPALSWTAPTECPDQPAIRARIASLLARDPASASEDPDVRAQGNLTRGRNGYKLTLTVKSGGASGTRTLAGGDCTELSDTAAWLIAVAIDPNAPATPPPAPVPAPTPTPVAPPAPPPPPVLPVPPPQSEPSAWSLLGAGFFGVWQAERPRSPRLQPGVALGFGYRWLDTELRAAFALPRDRDIPNGGGRVRSETEQYALMSCARLGARFRYGPCLGAAFAVTQASPRDHAGLQTQRARWASLLFGVQTSYAISTYWELFAEAGVSVPQWARPGFSVDKAAVFHVAAVGGYGRLGVRFRWALPPRRAH